jgi:hypothetical protein
MTMMGIGIYSLSSSGVDVLLMAFFGFGYVIAAATGNLNQPSGFSLDGWPAFLLLVSIPVYFYVGRRMTNGTLWDRFFGIVRPQPR